MSHRGLWSRDKTYKLIEYYEKASILWNSRHRDFRNRDLKQCAIHNIARSLHLDPPEITKKLHSLRCQMNEEMRKYKQHKIVNGNDSWESRWVFFESMMFITTSPSYRGPVKLTAADMQAKFEVVEQVTPRSLPRKKQRKSKPNLNNNLTNECSSTSNNYSGTSDQNFNTSNQNTSTDIQYISVGTQCTAADKHESIDEHVAFGNFVSSELRLLESASKRKRLRLTIQKAIIAIAEDNEREMPELIPMSPTRNRHVVSVTSRETVIYSPRSHRSGNVYGGRRVNLEDQIVDATGPVLIQENCEVLFRASESGSPVKQEYYE